MPQRDSGRNGKVARATRDPELRVFESADDARRAAGELLAAAASRGEDIALAGGSTPGGAYEQAALLEPDWSGATLWWSDERCVPPDDERSNYRLARESLLDRLKEAPAQNRIRGELGGADAAEEYDRLLQGVSLGFAILGIGSDGHTASLFPGSPALQEQERRAVAVESRDVERVTMTLPVLCGAQHVVFLALGEEKAPAVCGAFRDPPSPITPASLVRSATGNTTVLLDRPAAAKLDN